MAKITKQNKKLSADKVAAITLAIMAVGTDNLDKAFTKAGILSADFVDEQAGHDKNVRRADITQFEAEVLGKPVTNKNWIQTQQYLDSLQANTTPGTDTTPPENDTPPADTPPPAAPEVTANMYKAMCGKDEVRQSNNKECGICGSRTHTWTAIAAMLALCAVMLMPPVAYAAADAMTASTVMSMSLLGMTPLLRMPASGEGDGGGDGTPPADPPAPPAITNDMAISYNGAQTTLAKLFAGFGAPEQYDTGRLDAIMPMEAEERTAFTADMKAMGLTQKQAEAFWQAEADAAAADGQAYEQAMKDAGLDGTKIANRVNAILGNTEEDKMVSLEGVSVETMQVINSLLDAGSKKGAFPNVPGEGEPAGTQDKEYSMQLKNGDRVFVDLTKPETVHEFSSKKVTIDGKEMTIAEHMKYGRIDANEYKALMAKAFKKVRKAEQAA